MIDDEDMDMDDFFENGEFIVNYDKIIKSKKSLSVTRLLAADMMSNPYTTIGDFLKSIHTKDLETLLLLSDDSDNENFADLILMAEMLVRAEGLAGSDSSEALNVHLKKFLTFLAIEGLHRKGLVRAFRENMSFGEDMEERVIVEKIND